MEPYIGKLEEVPLYRVFQQLYLNGASGFLDLQHHKEQRRISWVQGNVRSALSNRQEQKIGSFLVQKGLLQTSQLEEILKDSSPQPIGEKIVRRGWISEDILIASLKELIKEIIFECFGWHQGMFRFTPKSAPIRKEIEIDVTTADIIFQGTKRFALAEGIEKFFQNPKLILMPNPNLKMLFQQIQLSSQEGFLFSLMDGKTPVEATYSLVSLPKEEIHRILYAFYSTGMLQLKEKDARIPLESFFEKYALHPGKKIVGKKTRKTIKIFREKKVLTFSEKDIQILRQKILEKYKKLHQMNYYEILECPLKATQKEIHFAFLNLSTFYHPDMATKKGFEDLKPQLEAIFQRLEEAYRTLVDYDQRILYDRRMGFY